MHRNETSSTSVAEVCDVLRTSISCFFRILKSKNLWFWFWKTPQKPTGKPTGFHEMAGKRTRVL
jgi:hypothetical protein